jgi:tetratricopeptide (TPR) repeat protein
VAKKKYTRKQLKQPDEFITFSNKVWEFVRQHVVGVVITIIVASVGIGAAWAVTAYKESKAADATGLLDHAIEVYSQSLLPDTVDASQIKKDDIPRFKTTAEKLGAAEKAFSAVIEKGGTNGPGQLALLLRGSVRYDAKKYTEAVADYKAFLDEDPEPRLRKRAQEGIGYCYEAEKKWQKAMAAFAKLPSKGKNKFQGDYHKARLLALQGKKKEAAVAYRTIVDQAEDQTLVARAGERLAMLESK